MQTAHATQLRAFEGLRATTSAKPVQAKVIVPRSSRRSVVTRAGFLGSPENLIMVASTTAFLAAGRFGLAPTSSKNTDAGLKYVPTNVGLKTNDPAGFTAVDTLALGACGHGIAVGIILGLKGIGAL